MPPEVSGATAPTKSPPKPSETDINGPTLKPSASDYDGSCYFSENSKWVPGKIVEYVGTSIGASAIIATNDRRLVSVRLADVRHGSTEPEAMPHLMSFNANGQRQHTIRQHIDGRWLVASPDGVLKGEFDDEESAKAKHAQLENMPVATPVPAKPWKEAG